MGWILHHRKVRKTARMRHSVVVNTAAIAGDSNSYRPCNSLAWEMTSVTPGASVTLFFCPITKEWIMSHRCIDSQIGWTTSYGSLVRYMSDEFQLRGHGDVVASFAAFSRRDSSDPDDFQKMTTEQRERFYQSHLQISIVEYPAPKEQVWMFCPMSKASIGYHCLPENLLIIPMPVSREQFFAALSKCIEHLNAERK